MLQKRKRKKKRKKAGFRAAISGIGNISFTDKFAMPGEEHDLVVLAERIQAEVLREHLLSPRQRRRAMAIGRAPDTPGYGLSSRILQKLAKFYTKLF
jgi:hypothetical protein